MFPVVSLEIDCPLWLERALVYFGTLVGMAGPYGRRNNDKQPHALTQPELADLLRPFGIRPRTVRERGKDKTQRGYWKKDFEQAWKSYCP